jgi:hypothetical protein
MKNLQGLLDRWSQLQTGCSKRYAWYAPCSIVPLLDRSRQTDGKSLFVHTKYLQLRAVIPASVSIAKAQMDVEHEYGSGLNAGKP